jgi:hypothetical protein
MRRMAVVVIMLVAVSGCSGGAAGEMDTSEPWDLVWFSDSTGFGLAELWGERIEQELGVEVRVHDKSAGGLAAATVLGWIDEGDSSLPVLRETLAEAEVVVVFGNPRQSGYTADEETCVSTSPFPRDPPVHYTAEDWAPYRDVLSSIYEVVFDLRDGQPTVVRAMDMYNATIADWREAGIEAECMAAWEVFAQTIRDAAADYDVPTASMLDAFNGADHSEDPRDKGFISADKMHTTGEGKAAMVEALHALGYDPVGG